jgi:hypothetical protein
MALLMKWRDDMKESESVYKLSEVIFSVVEKQPKAAELCRDLAAQSKSNAKRLEEIIIGYNAPKP